MTPERWRRVDITSFGDGDTLRAHLTGHPMPFGHRLTITAETTDPRGDALRLTWIDTPERGKEGYYDAKGDLATWLLDHEPWLVATTYEIDTFGRYITDVYDVRDGSTASEWMLHLGWPLWED